MITKKTQNHRFTADEIHFLRLLSRSFPNVATASTEIINLEAILNLPKGTAPFLADLHGEYEAFQHVLRNASGTIKRKVKDGSTVHIEIVIIPDVTFLVLYKSPCR